MVEIEREGERRERWRERERDGGGERGGAVIKVSLTPPVDRN